MFAGESFAGESFHPTSWAGIGAVAVVDTGGGGWWQVGGQSRRSHAPVTSDIPKPSRNKASPSTAETQKTDAFPPDISIPDELTRLEQPAPRETTTQAAPAPQNHLWPQNDPPRTTNKPREPDRTSDVRSDDEARRQQRDDEAERKRIETKARRDARHQRQKQQRQLSRAHRMVDRQRRAEERERKREQAIEDEALLVLMMVAMAT